MALLPLVSALVRKDRRVLSTSVCGFLAVLGMTLVAECLVSKEITCL